MGKLVVTKTITIETPFPDEITPRVMKAMHDDGASLRQLADKFKVSRETIRTYIMRVEDAPNSK